MSGFRLVRLRKVRCGVGAGALAGGTGGLDETGIPPIIIGAAGAGASDGFNLNLLESAADSEGAGTEPVITGADTPTAGAEARAGTRAGAGGAATTTGSTAGALEFSLGVRRACKRTRSAGVAGIAGVAGVVSATASGNSGGTDIEREGTSARVAGSITGEGVATAT